MKYMEISKMTNNDKVPELTKSEFENFIKQGLVFINFFAEWCMPCLMMDPVIDELSEKFKGKIKFGKVDVGDNQELAQKFEVRSIPNFVLLKDGKVTEHFIGSMPSEELEEKLKKHIK
jgi:thioredoxin 1